MDQRFISLATGRTHACGITQEGRAYCWGSGERGQLGNGGEGHSDVPVPVLGELLFSSIATGVYHTCGITRDGAGYCWGRNDYGALGVGQSIDGSSVPLRVSGGLTLSSMALGTLHTCALTTDGLAYCWGSNRLGQLGVDLGRDQAVYTIQWADTPHLLLDAVTLRAITAGRSVTCGVTSQGVTLCWGTNEYGQIGIGWADSDSIVSEPTLVSGDIELSQISAGYQHVCGIAPGGLAYCWGRADEGRLGQPSVPECRDCRGIPTLVTPDIEFEHISSGFDHTCGLSKDRIAHCWGRNWWGQLGDGTQESRMELAPVGGQPILFH